jgi:hypothetical protein
VPGESDSNTPLLRRSKRSKKKRTGAETFAAESASGNTTQLGSENARPKGRPLVGVFIPSSKPRLTLDKSQTIESAHTANSELESSHRGILYATSEDSGYEGYIEDIESVHDDEDAEGVADHGAPASDVNEEELGDDDGNVEEVVDDDEDLEVVYVDQVDGEDMDVDEEEMDFDEVDGEEMDVEEVDVGDVDEAEDDEADDDDADDDEDREGEEFRTSPSRFLDTEASETGIQEDFLDWSLDNTSDASSGMRNFVVDDHESILVSASDATVPLYHWGESTHTTPSPTVKSELGGSTQLPSIKEELPTGSPTIKSEAYTTTPLLDRNIALTRRTRNRRIVLSDDEDNKSNAMPVHGFPDLSLSIFSMSGQGLGAAQDVAPFDTGTEASLLEDVADDHAAARPAEEGSPDQRMVSLSSLSDREAVHARLPQDNTLASLPNIDVPKRKRGRPRKAKVDIPKRKRGRPKKVETR